MTVAGDFVKNLQRLIDQTPREVKGGVKVNQVYAHYQHAHPEFRHPSGGEAFYLTTPLFAKVDKYMRAIGEACITKDGVNLVQPMADQMEDLSTEVYNRAPWEFGDLRASGNPWVEADGEVWYDRPPNCARLSEDELKIKDHLRYLTDPHRYDR